ncbi:MAG: molybdenum cofactor guanylyltransferase [Bacteroidales bacterium]|nr:molybdenum cofactor guanylyltransferase [Bacteroidales bacterium]
MTFTSIILAGGKSKRMGTNKALVPFMGKPLIQYSIDLARSCSNDILISANSRDLDFLGFPVVKDMLAINAPLAGIHAGLKSSDSDWNLILTCDMPNVAKELIERLLRALNDNLMMVVPCHGGLVEPLCGFYHKKIIARIEDNIAAGKLSLLDLMESGKHKLISVDEILPEEIDLLFRNVNEKKDLLG